MMENLWQGREAQEGIGSVEIVSKYRGSCGCAQSIDEEAVKRLFRYKEQLQNALYHGSSMYVDMENTDTFRALMNVGRAYISAIRFNRIYICMCDEQERQEEKVAMMNQYTEHMVLRNIMNMQEDIPHEDRFPRRELLPAAYRREGEILYISTLHEKNDCFGYAVLTTDYPDDLRYQFQTWISGMSMTLARLHMYEENQALNEMRLQYGRDELTGISNRREMERALQKLYDRLRQKGESFYVVSVDMDGLKYINDHYGHLEETWPSRLWRRFWRLNRGRRDWRPARAGTSSRSVWQPGPRGWWRHGLQPSVSGYAVLTRVRTSPMNSRPVSVTPAVTRVSLC